MVKTRFCAGLLSYFTSVALSGTGLTNEKKNKFSVKTIKSSLILENIIGFDGLINIDRVVGSEWIMPANVISCGEDVVETVFRCLI